MSKAYSIAELHKQRLESACMVKKLKEKDTTDQAVLKVGGMEMVLKKKLAIRLLQNNIRSLDSRIQRQQDLFI